MAITYGMSTTEFWEQEPDLLWAYHKSFLERMKVEQSTNNFNAWLQGMYIFDGVSKAIYNSFGRKSGQRILEYVPKPYEFDTKEKDELERIQEMEERIRARNKEIAQILNKNK